LKRYPFTRVQLLMLGCYEGIGGEWYRDHFSRNSVGNLGME
jgi:hypothetical protein